jgi:hypothetical protein
MGFFPFIIHSDALSPYHLHNPASHADWVILTPTSLPVNGQKKPIKILFWFPASIDDLSGCDAIFLDLPFFNHK